MKTEIQTPPEWRVPIAGYIAWLSLVRPKSTCKQRSYQLRRFAAETGISPRRVTHDDLITYLGSHGWGKSSIHTAQTTLKSFFRWAHLVAKVVDESPAELLPPTRSDRGFPRPASEDAISTSVAAADRRVRLMIELAARAGLRCCEIAKVHTGDVHFTLEDGWCLQVRGKGGKPREVPLKDSLAAALREYDPGFIFPGQEDGHLSPAYVSKLVSRALPDGVTAHMLRHRFASIAYIGAEHDIRTVQELLGHANVATTQIYTAVPAGAKRLAVNAA